MENISSSGHNMSNRKARDSYHCNHCGDPDAHSTCNGMAREGKEQSQASRKAAATNQQFFHGREAAGGGEEAGVRGSPGFLPINHQFVHIHVLQNNCS